MICLWGFLLLAVATSSVDSEFSTCSCNGNKVVKEAWEQHSYRITNTQPPSKMNLNLLSSVTSSLTNKINSLTGAVFKHVEVEKAEIHNTGTGWELDVQIEVDVSCVEFLDLDVKVSISAGLNLNAQGGKGIWSRTDKALSITADINNTELKLESTVAGAIAKTVVGVLDNTLKSITHVCVDRLNNAYRQATKKCYAGTAEIAHEITGFTQEGGNVVGAVSTKINGEIYAWPKIGDTTLTGSQANKWNIAGTFITPWLQAQLQQVRTKINVPKGLVSAQLWGNLYDDVSVEISVNSLKNSKLRQEESLFDLDLDISLFGNSTSVATAQAGLPLTAIPEYRRGHLRFGSSFGNSPSIDNLSVISADPRLGAKESIGVWLNEFLTENLYIIEKDISCIAGDGLLLPSPLDGEAGPDGQCESQIDHWSCWSSLT